MSSRRTPSTVPAAPAARAKAPRRVGRPAGPTPVADTGRELGVLALQLRKFRADKGFTLQQLSARSGIAASTLSKIETGQLSPTYEKVAALADGLDVDVGDLFAPTPVTVSGRRSVTRRGEGVPHGSPQYDYRMLCAEVSGKQFLPIFAHIKARSLAEFGDLARHDGEEFVYVLAGEVEIHSEFYAPLRLAAGDSCYFDSRMGHALLAGGDDDAQILWVCSKKTQVPV